MRTAPKNLYEVSVTAKVHLRFLVIADEPKEVVGVVGLGGGLVVHEDHTKEILRASVRNARGLFTDQDLLDIATASVVDPAIISKYLPAAPAPTSNSTQQPAKRPGVVKARPPSTSTKKRKKKIP